jgi:hypothetical protein
VNRLLPILFLLLTLTSARADLVVSNNAIIVLLGDSFFTDDTAPITGHRIPDYLESYFDLTQVGRGIHVFDVSRSGGTMANAKTNGVHPYALPLWGFGFNNYQHIGMLLSTDNGGLSSNQMYLAHADIYQSPTNMSNGDDTLATQSGWASSNRVQWVGLGYPPSESSTGDPVNEAGRNNGGTNAGWTLGALGVDLWNTLAPSWTNDFNANGGTNVQWFPSPKAGHFASGGALSVTFAILRGIPSLASDTNISTCTVDWNSSSPVATNHCVVSTISKSGNILTFTRHDDRLPFAWDVADGTITNDASGAFALNPSDADFFKFTLQITNLPAGNYSVLIDGVPVATLTNTALATGWNMFTNTVGPYWAQRKEVLGRIRDKEYVDRVTLVPGSAGDQLGMVSYGSNASTQWGSPNNKRGDVLINSVSNNVVNVLGFDTLTATAATPTNHTFAVIQIQPRFVGAHR